MPQYDKVWSDDTPDEIYIAPVDEHEISLFEQNDVKRILDLGSGDGRNMVILAKKGFRMTGLDISAIGIDVARERLESQGLWADLVFHDIFKGLPFTDNSFDAVMSYQALYHGTIDQIKNAILDIKRVLRRGGILSLKVTDSGICPMKSLGAQDANGNELFESFNMKWRSIAPNTYVPVEGDEIGLIHYIFAEGEIVSLLEEAGFVMIDKRTTPPGHLLANFRNEYNL